MHTTPSPPWTQMLALAREAGVSTSTALRVRQGLRTHHASALAVALAAARLDLLYLLPAPVQALAATGRASSRTEALPPEVATSPVALAG